MGQGWVRLGFFLAVALVVGALERGFPRRKPTRSRVRRWGLNFSLAAVNAVLPRFFPALLPVSVAMAAGAGGWGLLPAAGLTGPAAFVVAIVFLDLTVYFQHLMFHAVPVLWRLHMVHHVDKDIDMSTGVRFHPVEILISAGVKSAMAAVLGPPVGAVVAFEVILNAAAVFNHGNIRLPANLDAALRWLMVTPDMHRVHHSVFIRETNSNFGFNLSVWDRLFGTYRPRPAAGHSGMTIGISHVREDKWEGPGWLLLLPFVKSGGRYPLGMGARPPFKRPEKNKIK